MIANFLGTGLKPPPRALRKMCGKQIQKSPPCLCGTGRGFKIDGGVWSQERKTCLMRARGSRTVSENQALLQRKAASHTHTH